MLWALAAAFGIVLLLGALRGVWNVILKVGLLILLLVGLAYPVLGLLTRTNNFHLDRAWSLVDTIRTSQDETQKMSARQELNSLWTLDYFELVQRQTPDEAAAIRWLQAAPDAYWPKRSVAVTLATHVSLYTLACRQYWAGPGMNPNGVADM